MESFFLSKYAINGTNGQNVSIKRADTIISIDANGTTTNIPIAYQNGDSFI